MSVFHLDAGADWFADAARGVSAEAAAALYDELGDEPETKAAGTLRRVRTPAGSRHYGLPIGSVIRPDAPDLPAAPRPRAEFDPDAFYKRPRVNREWASRVRRRTEIQYPAEGDPEPKYSPEELFSDAPLAEPIGTREEAEDARDVLQTLVDDSRVWTRLGSYDALEDLVDGDRRLKAQYETDSSSGFFAPDFRREAERVLFGIEPSEPAERAPIYGYLSAYDHGNLDEYNAASEALMQYGTIAVRLKAEAGARTTFTLGDSLDASNVAIQDGPAQERLKEAGITGVAAEFQLMRARGQLGTDAHLTPLPATGELALEAIDGLAEEILYADGGAIDDLETPQGYVEAQVHGGVTLDDVDRVVFGSSEVNAEDYDGPFAATDYDWLVENLLARGIEVWYVDEDGGQIRYAPDGPGEKAVRRVRTPEGARTYGQPIGTVIKPDVPRVPGRRTVADLEPGLAVRTQAGVLTVARVNTQGRVYFTDGTHLLLPGGRGAEVDVIEPPKTPAPRKPPTATPKPKGGRGTGVDFEVDQYKLYRALLKVDPKMMTPAKGKTHALSKLVAERWTSLRQIGNALEEAEAQGLVKLGRHKWTLAYHLRDLMGQGEGSPKPSPKPKTPRAKKPDAPAPKPVATPRRAPVPLPVWKKADSWSLLRPTGTREWSRNGYVEARTPEEADRNRRLNSLDQAAYSALTGHEIHGFAQVPPYQALQTHLFDVFGKEEGWSSADDVPTTRVTDYLVDVMERLDRTEVAKRNLKKAPPERSAESIPDRLRPRLDVADPEIGVAASRPNDDEATRYQILEYAAKFVTSKNEPPSDAAIADYLRQERELAQRTGQRVVDLTPADVRRALVEVEQRYRAKYGFEPPLDESKIVRPTFDPTDKAHVKAVKAWLSAKGFTPSRLKYGPTRENALKQWQKDPGRPYDLDEDTFLKTFGPPPLHARNVFGKSRSVPAELAEEMGVVWDGMEADYPHAMSLMKELVVTRLGGNTYADYASWDKRIRFNTEYVGERLVSAPQYDEQGRYSGVKQVPAKPKIYDSVKSDAQTGWHPPGTDVPGSVLTHELGHHLHLTVMNPAQRTVLAERVNAWLMRYAKHKALNAPQLDPDKRFEHRNPTYEQEVHKYWANEIGVQVSRYAKKNEKEFFAEAFAEYRHSTTPRGLARVVGEYVDEIMKGVATNDEFMARRLDSTRS